MTIDLDFETRSAFDIRKANVSVYARHPSTIVLCLAYRLPGDPTIHLWKQGDPPPEALFEAIIRGALVRAHNVGFERYIWQYVCVERMGWVAVPDDQWRCTMAVCCYRSLPRSLNDASQALNLPVKKDMEGNRVMLKLCKPRKETKNNKALYHNDPRDFKTLYSYCIGDVATQIALAESTGDLPPDELRTWQLDQRINARGIPIDRHGVQNALAVVQQSTKDLDAKVSALTKGLVDSARAVEQCLTWLKHVQNYPLKDLAKATVDEALLDPNIPSAAKDLLLYRQSSSKSSTAKLQAILNHADADDRVRCSFVWHAAHSGRWGGSGVQFQNLKRRSLPESAVEQIHDLLQDWNAELIELLFGPPIGAISDIIRSFVCAPEGWRLLVCDFANIEGRVVMWLAGQRDALQAFEEGRDVYKEMASKIYRVQVKKVDKTQRQVGKVACLGLQYGMSAKKFVEAVKAMTGLVIGINEATAAVEVYRNTNDRVVQLWRDVQRAAVAAIQIPGASVKAGRLTFMVKNGKFAIRLPSGRHLWYQKPSIAMVPAPWDETQLIPQIQYWGVNSMSRKWEQLRTYGGKLVENVTQAVAADFLIAAMHRCEAQDYPLIATIHDELVCEMENGKGSLSEFCDIIRATPDPWMAGCPIEVAGGEARRYVK